MTSWRQRLLGAEDRLGWWTLPLFLAVGLAGAVLAGSLAAIYYAQQVDTLEAETREARRTAERAAEEIAEARDAAVAEIDQQLAAVEETLSRAFPFDDVAEQGLAVIRASVTAADEGAGAAVPEERVGVGFVVATEGTSVFLTTSFTLVADPATPDGVVEQVEVAARTGRAVGQVHSWDPRRDLAVVRAEVGELPILRWRRSDEPLALGERVVVAGLTPELDGVQLAGHVGLVTPTVLVTDLRLPPFLRGAPIVDARGHVVAVASDGYQPFGAEAADGQVAVPVRLLCERMLRNCDALEAEPTEDG